MIYSDKIINKTIARLSRAQQANVEAEVQNELRDIKNSIMNPFKEDFKNYSKLYYLCLSKITDLENSLELYEEQTRFLNNQYYLDRTIYKIVCYDNYKNLYKIIADTIYRKSKEK